MAMISPLVANSREIDVFSAPNHLLPMEATNISPDDDEDTFADFFSNLLQSAQHGPWDEQSQCQVQQHADVHIVMKQEQETGFLDQLKCNQQQQQHDSDPNRYSPEDQKKYESQLIKEELSCRIQLKMMKEGKSLPTEVEDQQSTKEYQISAETRQLQKVRREKNREAAKKCRQKKKETEKELEQKVRESEKSIKQLQQQLTESGQEFSQLLEGLHSLPCFLAYLRKNRQVLRSPHLKPVLQKFAKTQGCQLAPSQCFVCPIATSAGAEQSSVEQ